MASLVLSGDTSGSVTISVPNIAGANVVTMPAGTGVFNVSSSTTTTSTATLTPVATGSQQYNLTAQAVNLTIAAPTGTPIDAQRLMFRILDNGTARTITWNATYTAIGIALPTTTVVNKTTYVGCTYNANNVRWDVIAVTTQA